MGKGSGLESEIDSDRPCESSPTKDGTFCYTSQHKSNVTCWAHSLLGKACIISFHTRYTLESDT